jgi:predicted amidohydrolase
MKEKVRTAAVQMDPALKKTEENLEKIAHLSERAADAGARLIIFPECAISGYCFDSAAEASPCAQPVPGEWTDRLGRLSRRLGIFLVAGMLEREGGEIYNTAVFTGPDGMVGTYRKTHLPYLGVDRFTRPGAGPVPVFDTPLGKIGLHICFDGSNPEIARVMKLKGAELLILITNWPVGAEISCRFMCQTRAVENHVNYVAVNRTGEEGGFRFLGESKILDYTGKVLAAAGTSEEMILGDIDFEGANRNRIINIPGKYELDRIATRRPELYSEIIKMSGPARSQGTHGTAGPISRKERENRTKRSTGRDRSG